MRLLRCWELICPLWHIVALFSPEANRGFVNVLCFHTTPLLGILSPINSCENWMFGSTFPSVVHQSIKQHIQYFNWLVVWNMYFIFSIQLGISSSQLTYSYFSEGRYTTNKSSCGSPLGSPRQVSPWWTGNLPYV